ncbi:DUF6345 domain-containing protein [Kribbella sp. GL6]|uniref:DUF6345 domain-containing protein n=1 Tax=Kribbella sp. GL6 TaxID=3419765 RepID=UPI003CFCC6EE
MAITIGVVWATHFQRQGLNKLWYRRLRYAYRAPSLFLEGMLAAGAEAHLVTFDENLDDADLDPGGSAQQVDILYVATHGMRGANGFELALHANDWRLLGGGFGDNGPAIVIFDCCDLVDLTAKDWDRQWRTDRLGPELRLILGFASPASVSLQASIRGTAFARELATKPVTDAWFVSIQAGSYVGTDKPVAIAFGDDDQDARNVLDQLSIGALPGPRTSAVPGVAWRS